MQGIQPVQHNMMPSMQWRSRQAQVKHTYGRAQNGYISRDMQALMQVESQIKGRLLGGAKVKSLEDILLRLELIVGKGSGSSIPKGMKERYLDDIMSYLDEEIITLHSKGKNVESKALKTLVNSLEAEKYQEAIALSKDLLSKEKETLKKEIAKKEKEAKEKADEESKDVRQVGGEIEKLIVGDVHGNFNLNQSVKNLVTHYVKKNGLKETDVETEIREGLKDILTVKKKENKKEGLLSRFKKSLFGQSKNNQKNRAETFLPKAELMKEHEKLRSFQVTRIQKLKANK